MQRFQDDIYETLHFDLLHLSETDLNFLPICLQDRLKDQKCFITCKEVFETNEFTSSLKKIRFSLQQEVLFYKPQKGKAYVWGVSINRGMDGEIVNIIFKLKLSESGVHLQPMHEHVGKKIFRINDAAKKEQADREVSFANRLGYLGHVKGPYVFAAPYGGYNRAIIIMRKLPGQSLEGFIDVDGVGPQQNNAHPLTSWQRLRLLAALFRATTFLHAAHIVHRDFSPKNLQITKEPYCSARWIDLGLSRDECVQDNNNQPACGTPLYWSSQAASYVLQTQTDDLFAMGLIAGELLCADQSHVNEYKDIETCHANYQFHNLFRFMSKDGLLPTEESTVINMLMNIVTNDFARRWRPAACLKQVEPIQAALLQRLHPKSEELYKAFSLGQLNRDLMDADQLFDWLKFSKVITALERFATHFDQIADLELALHIFLEKAECGVLFQFKRKVDMKNQINLWLCQLKVCAIEWGELTQACTAVSPFATEQNKAVLTAVQARITQLEQRFKVQVHWDDLPSILDELAKHVNRLSRHLKQMHASVSQLGQFAVTTARLALIEQSTQKRIKY